MRAAILSLVIAGALAASAGTADARPPRYSSNHSVPARTLSLYDEARYGEFLPYSAPGSAFYDYGVAYPRPYYRSGNGPVNPPVPTYGPRGGYIGTYNGGIFGSWRR